MMKQLKLGVGYDHNWVLNNQNGSLALAAEVYEPTKGRVMQILTTEPGIQFYAGQSFEWRNRQIRTAFIQNVLVFAWKHSTILIHRIIRIFLQPLLKSGETYQSTTIYRFTIR